MRAPSPFHSLLPALLCGLLVACATAPPTGDIRHRAHRVQQDHLGHRPFTSEILSGLLSAEISARQGRTEDAADHYLALARLDDDPWVHARAVQVLLATNRNESALQLAETLPADADAELAASRLQARLQARGAAAFIAALPEAIRRHPDLNLDFVGRNSRRLSMPQRRLLENALANLELPAPAHLKLQFQRALMLRDMGENSATLALTLELLEAKPGWQAAATLALDTMNSLGQHRQALAFAAKHRALLADNLWALSYLTYAHQVTGDLAGARVGIRALEAKVPYDPHTRLQAARILAETGDQPGARWRLESLLHDPWAAEAASWQLGFMDERAGDVEAALNRYRQVPPGAYFLRARQRLVSLLSQRGELHGAMEEITSLPSALRAGDIYGPDLQRLAEAVASQLNPEQLLRVRLDYLLLRHPDNLAALYRRSLLHAAAGALDAAEQDLRAVLAEAPEDPNALNALGYILAMAGHSLQEAERLVIRALGLQPETPAFMDSLGWVHYRLGRLDSALEMLTRAHALDPDPEISAHLGEILWQLGRRDEARDIWQRGLEHSPEHRVLTETQRRLDPAKPTL